LEYAIRDTENGLGRISLSIHKDVIAYIAMTADGDARTALNNLQLIVDVVEPGSSNIRKIDLETAEKETKYASVSRAMIMASEVLPHPGGPQKIIENGLSSSIARRIRPPPASMWDCPTKPSRFLGRIRSASGRWTLLFCPAASAKRSIAVFLPHKEVMRYYKKVDTHL
jgi:hypothetical protein